MLNAVARLFRSEDRHVAVRGKRRARRATPRARQLLFEPLESRVLLSVSLAGVPDWVDQGPEPILNASSVITPNNPATGAVQTVAVNPNNAQQIYVGSVNGGVWRSNNADPNNPGAVTWTPLTNQQLSLAIGTIEFGRLDNSGNTIYAGTGSFSNLTWSGPPPTAIGILRSTDGGASWTNFAVNPGNEGRIKAIVPTGIDMDPGAGTQEMVLVAAIDGGGGVYRSDDGGRNFVRLSGANGLPNGGVTQMIADPNNVNRFYAALPGLGVYRGDFNAGVITWTQVNGTGTNVLGSVATSANIQLAAHNDGAGNTALYVGLANGVSGISATLTGVFRSADAGTNWNALGTPAGFNAFSVGGSGFNLIADGNAASNQVVYIGGLGGGGSNLWRNDGVVNTWTRIAGTGFASNNTTPHADSRDMAFIGNDTLVETDDGGIYYLSTPTNANTTGWRSFIGETNTGNALGGVEFHSIAWDSISNIIIGGAQDNGTSIQRTTGDVIYTSVAGGDGGDVLADAFTLAGANQSIRYFSSQNLGIGTTDSFRRQVFDTNNGLVGGEVAVLPAGGLANFTAQFINPIEINAIAPTAAQLGAGQSTRVVVGGGGANPVYESSDAGTAANPTWTAANVPTAGPGVTTIGTITAMAYGGRRSGVDNPDVLYVGDNNGNVFVRTAAGGTLTATASPFPGGQVTDIALDPNDWQHAFVTDANGVWETTDGGATNWVARTGNLNAVQRVGAGNSVLQTVEYCELGAVDCVLVGGWGGVFRMSTANAGQWSEYGQFLPNAVTYELDYNAADNTLIAGTFGGGAWSIANAANTLLTTGVLQVFGDDDFSGQNDTIVLAIDPSNPSMLDVLVNNDFFQYQLATIDQINVDSFGGNDKLIVDSTNGLISVVNGIRFNGGDQSDSLELRQTGGPTRSTDTYGVGPNNGQGVSTIFGGGNAGTQTVSFQNLEPVLDLVPVATLIVNATNGDNAINYTAGVGAGNGLVSIDAHETIEFANKTNLIINALAGVDTVNINNATTPAGLGTITVNGGDPGAGDALTIAGAGAAVAVDTGTATITGATGATGGVSLSYSGIETLALTSGVTGLTLTSNGANDALTVTPGAAGAANSGTLISSGALPSISFVNSGAVTANLGGGNDAVTVNGTASADAIAVGSAAVTITGRNAVNYAGAESVAVNGLTGADTFDVTPSAVAVFIDGGDPVGQLPGDLLNIAAGGGSVTYNAGPETDEGSFVVGANAAVNFDHIESFGISNSGPVTINGTNGPDAITVIARDATYNAAADGVRDFTVSVNTGPQILFLEVGALAVNALAGADQVTLVAPAPNNAVWDVDVTISGGPPAAGDADQLVVQTPGAAAETVVYAPSAADSGSLDLMSLSSLVAFTEIESLNYDGQGDNDSLVVQGTSGDDTIVHTPGANDQAGRFAVNSLLPISYQNMGAGATLRADGLGGGNTLVVQGTGANDAFGVDAAGRVGLNNRLPIDSAGNSTLTLEGLAGDDMFTLVPALAASAYTTMNFNGGAQASATGDRVFLSGSAGDDAFVVSGQTVSLGGKSMVGSGIENIRTDAAGGTNRITYNGVAGVAENITVASSGVAGGGQIIVPDVTLVDFSAVQFISVNGNVPGPSETDTLAFAGTNAVDLFSVKMHAAGTDADPVLKLQASASATLLTLAGYTNFNTLGINGLDGADTFNVYTANAGAVDRNILIDGGSPTAKKKSTDQLNVYYTGNRPRIIQSAATQNPGSGLVDLQYPSRRFLVQYADLEDVTIPKGVAPW
jgi:precorrin-6B methylase 2